MADQGIVALLFTDLVGSTSMYDRIGDERAEAVRRAHFASLRQALAAHGGHEVKSLGDGLMVVFSSAVAAVDAAIAMQRTSAAGTTSDHRPEIRVGLHAGEPLHDEGDYFGVSVNTARRLCDAAASGQIIASDLIRALVSPRMRSGLRPIGDLELKGIEEPVTAYEVEWTPPVETVALPPLLSVPDGAPFVGRSAELDRLEHLWKQAAEGVPGTVVISAESGMGKTRLVGELARRVVDAPALVLAGRCDPELAQPLQPFAEAVATAATAWPAEARPLVDHDGLDALRTAATSAHSATSADTERPRLFAAVTAMIQRAAATAPVLLVVDDVQWADESTVLLLRHVRRTPIPRLLLVATFRDGEPSTTPAAAAFLADLRSDHGATRLALGGLDAGCVEALLVPSGDAAADVVALASEVAQQTEGNAFFVTEVVRHLSEHGRIRQAAGQWQVVRDGGSLTLPDGVREVIARRLARLSPDANELLHVAAVVGREFPIRLVAEVAALDLDRALDAVDESLSASVVVEGASPGTFAFRHALLRECLAGDLSSVRRMRLHLRIADALRTAGGAAGEVARHLLEAAPIADAREVGSAALAAAAHARFRLAAYEDAATVARRGLDALGPQHPDLRCDLLTILGESRFSVGDIHGLAALDEALALAEELDDPARMAPAITYAMRAGLPPEASTRYGDAAAAALAALTDTTSPVRARLRSALAMARMSAAGAYGVDETLDVLQEARATGDSEATAYAALAHADALFQVARPEEARLVLLEVLARVNDGLDEVELPVGARLVQVALMTIDRPAAEQQIRRNRAERERLDTLAWADLLPRACVAYLEGRLDDVRSLVEPILLQPGGVDQAGPLLGMLSLERNEAESVLPLLEHEVATGGGPVWSAALSLFLADLGRIDDARIALDGTVERIGLEVGSTLGLAMVAEAAHLVGDVVNAAAAADRLEPFRGMAVMGAHIVCQGSTERYLAFGAAARGDADAAVSLLRQAIEANRRLGATLFVAHAQADLAALLRRRARTGDEVEAYRLLDDVRATADELALPRVRRRVDAATAAT